MSNETETLDASQAHSTTQQSVAPSTAPQSVAPAVTIAKLNETPDYWKKQLEISHADHSTAMTGLRNSRRDLYECLAAIYAMQEQYRSGTKECRWAIDVAVTAQLKAIQALTKDASADTAFKIVKAAVMGTAALSKVEKQARARQVSIYKTVLDAAYRHQVQPQDLADWIEKKQGLERIRLGKAAITPEQEAKQKVRDENIAAARAVLPNRKLAEIEDFDAAAWEIADVANGRHFAVIASVQDGVMVVHGVVKNDKAIKIMHEEFALAHQDELLTVAPPALPASQPVSDKGF